jgi:NAD-specific glutamate dehydrogenase
MFGVCIQESPSTSCVTNHFDLPCTELVELAELVDRLAILVAVRRFHGMGAADSRSLRFESYVRMQHFVRRSTYVPFRRFLGDVRREFMQRLSAAFHGTLGSYLRDAFQEGSADAVACVPGPRA